MDVSGIEDEYRLSADKPRLLYVKQPAADVEPQLARFLAGIEADASVSYRHACYFADLCEEVGRHLYVPAPRVSFARLDTGSETTSAPLPAASPGTRDRRSRQRVLMSRERVRHDSRRAPCVAARLMSGAGLRCTRCGRGD
jgi:hypothetical protein